MHWCCSPAVLAGPQEKGRRARAASQPLASSEAPYLATSERAAHPRQPPQESTVHAFHAQPLNHRILDAPVITFSCSVGFSLMPVNASLFVGFEHNQHRTAAWQCCLLMT